MARCNALKPGTTDIFCDKELGHEGDHSQGYGGLGHEWDNLDYRNGPSLATPSNLNDPQSMMLGVIRGAKTRDHALEPPPPPHVARNNSKMAWEDYQGRLAGRKREVFDALFGRLGMWINGINLHTQLVGGSQGVKRVRELRAEFDRNPHFGWRIEERRVEDSDWDYRLVRRDA
jgi:hypothetical protein